MNARRIRHLAVGAGLLGASALAYATTCCGDIACCLEQLLCCFQ